MSLRIAIVARRTCKHFQSAFFTPVMLYGYQRETRAIMVYPPVSSVPSSNKSFFHLVLEAFS